MANIDADIKERIRICIVKQRVKQKDFANGLGIKPGTLSNILTTHQNVPGSFYRAVAEKTDIDLNWLIRGLNGRH
jgi:transcriptional regulator with XRE-family HTH domain